MKTKLRNCSGKLAGRPTFVGWSSWLGAVVIALVTASCAFNTARPTSAELRSKDRRSQAVVLLRVVTEIDGKDCPAFPSSISVDSIWLGLGDFSTGGKIRPSAQRFLSKDTRKNGWTYLLLEPGIYYLAPHAPQNENAFAYDASWKTTQPCWRVDVPNETPVIYAGTLFVPGKGLWQIFGGRRMSVFDTERFEVRNEPALATAIHQEWLKDLGTLSTQLVQPHSPSEPITLETPRGR